MTSFIRRRQSPGETPHRVRRRRNFRETDEKRKEIPILLLHTYLPLASEFHQRVNGLVWWIHLVRNVTPTEHNTKTVEKYCYEPLPKKLRAKWYAARKNAVQHPLLPALQLLIRGESDSRHKC
ncbi:uncharacterized protein LOC117117796 [Anneissia japonica]|uniref:uncharacterized protein LOC117117796 n=1 Tax=Anneissia japonica TaxID=1529436 RepID=UPI0014259076|nr:uncharacterized protein LOC117117796 [Anneissia japonica]